MRELELGVRVLAGRGLALERVPERPCPIPWAHFREMRRKKRIYPFPHMCISRKCTHDRVLQLLPVSEDGRLAEEIVVCEGPTDMLAAASHRTSIAASMSQGIDSSRIRYRQSRT